LHRGRILKSEKWKEEVTVQSRHIPTFALRVMENTKNQVKTIEYPRTIEAGIFRMEIHSFTSTSALSVSGTDFPS
jgi:hypothetical protein